MNRRPRVSLWLMAALLLLGAVPAQGQTAEPDSSANQIPIGQGRLSQDAITLRFGTGSLDIRILPLDEGLLRLLSVDSYRALTSLVAEFRPKVDTLATSRGIRQPGLALVTFYGLAPNTRFDPQLLTLLSRNQFYRPVAILPLSPTFSNQQLDVRGQASAIFLYEQPIPVLEAFTVNYLSASTSEWERKLTRINAERARILGRRPTPPDTAP